MRFLKRWFVCALAIALAIYLVPGIVPLGDTVKSAIFAALALALVNATIKPIMKVLSLPLTILSLGVFSLVVNAVALEIASWLSVSVFGLGIYCTSFGAAFWGALVISVVSAILNAVIA